MGRLQLHFPIFVNEVSQCIVTTASEVARTLHNCCRTWVGSPKTHCFWRIRHTPVNILKSSSNIDCKIVIPHTAFYEISSPACIVTYYVKKTCLNCLHENQKNVSWINEHVVIHSSHVPQAPNKTLEVVLHIVES